MNSFCNDKFWNTNLTWHSAYPDFTDCFQETVLSWIPCIFLWIFAPIEIYYVKSDKMNRILRNSRNILKYILLSLFIGIKFVDLIYEVNSAPVYVVNPVIKMATFLLAMIQLRFQLKYGMQSSGVSFIFSSLLVICYIPQVKSAFNPAIPDYYKIISACLYFMLAIGLFLLNCFADEIPAENKLLFSEKMCPIKTASFLNRMFFYWLDPLILSGYRKALEDKDMYDTIPEYKCRNVTPKVETYSTILKLIFRQNTGLVIISALIRVLFDVFTLLSPFLLRLLISYSEGVDEAWKGYLYTVALFLIAVSISVLHGQSTYYAYLAGFKIRSAMVAAIYKKSLQMTNMSIQDSTLGQIVNLMSVDAQTIFMVLPQINFLWSAPFTIALTFYFLWGIIGPSSMSGLVVMILIVPINGAISTFLQKNQISNMKKKDERVKFVSEILNGIKVLKLYAWEPSFEKLIDGIRKLELKFLKNKGYLMAGIFFTFYIAPFLMSLASFATYVLIDIDNVLTAEIAFVTIAFFNILKLPLAMFPLVISQSLQAWVSIKRINTFLNRPEFKSDNVSHDQKGEDVVLIENGTFSWSTDESFQLKDINLKIQRQKLIAVVGPVGCGKSSLISAVLGETVKMKGYVNVCGSVAYVPQIPWILNTTIKENILFGADFNEAYYNKVLHACALNADIDILPGGDQTEIGEKGVNLSGGQKQRVSLARAVYANPDIILFDDPLSAVDAHVGKHIFDNVIGPNGLFKTKTRLFITHNITFLQQTDEIIVMKNGEIWENGTYQELMALDGTFATLITDYSNQKQVASANTEIDPDPKDATKQVTKAKKIDSTDATKLIEKEVAATGNVNWPIYIKYFSYVGFPLIAAIIFFYIISQIFTVLTSVLLIFWSEDQNTDDPGVQNMYLLSYSALGIGQAILVTFGTGLIVIGSARASKSIHGNLLTAILRLPMSFFDSTPIGRMLNRFSKDIDVIDGLLPDSFRGALLILLNVAGILIVIAVITPWFIVVVVPFTASYYFIQKYYIATSRQVNRIESTARSPIYSHFGETVAGRSSIRAYNVESRFIKKSQDLIDYHLSCNFSNVMCTLWLGVRLESLGSIILFFASLFTVIGRGDISPGSVGLSLNYALMITSNLCYLVYLISEVESYVVAIERLDEYINLPKEAEYNKPIKNQYWPESGAIEFQSFKVRYRDALDLVLKDVSFKVQPNERIGIVGRTGAGKSSITLSLFRIIEAAAGKIFIDDVDISTLGLQAIRSKITIIPQDPVLFSGTLRWNIDPFEAYSDSEIWTALEHAHLKTYVSNLPDGLWYTIAEGGENISVGQRQLICLARALLRKTKILILDEATAAVDLETDEIIQETIRREFKNCTILTIAHRLNTIMDSDKILVLSNGTIVEYDSPENLLKNAHGIFYGMAAETLSLYRRRKYDQCIDICNTLLQKNLNSQNFWELKMRAMTQRVYIDDIEADDGVPMDNDLDITTLATAPKPGTSLRTATGRDTALGRNTSRPRTMTGKPLTGMSRPGTLNQRAGTSMGGARTSLRTGSRTGSAINIRLGSASMFAVGDPTGPLFNTSRLNPAKYVDKQSIAKPLFEHLYYHEGDVRKALDLCEAVISYKMIQTAWWWHTQKARCYLALGNPRNAEKPLRTAIVQCPHPDSVLLLARVYIKIDQPMAALEVCRASLEKLPGESSLLTQQARIFELLQNLVASVRMYRQIAQIDAMNTEGLACIAVHHFYSNQPEMALLYYRRILSMGAHSPELYCNLALCCLYGGQFDLVLTLFQRALRLVATPEQKADIWYNLSFVAVSTGDFNLARRCLRLCISIDGSHGAALNNLGVLAIQSNQNTKGKSYIMAAKSALNDCDEINHNLDIIEKFK